MRLTTFVADGLVHFVRLDVLAVRARLDHREHVFLVLVVEVLGLELLHAHRVDEQLRDLLLSVGDLLVERREVEAALLDELVREVHQLQHERFAVRFHGGDVLARADHDARDRDPARIDQRVAQQRVCVAAFLLGLEIVRRVEVHRVDLVELDELHDLHRLRGLRAHRLEVVVGHHDVVALLVLVPAHEIGVLHLLVAHAAVALVEDAALVFFVKKIEAQVVAANGREQLHGDRDESEVDRAGPNRVCHVSVTLPCESGLSVAHRRKMECSALRPNSLLPERASLCQGAFERLGLPTLAPPRVAVLRDEPRHVRDRPPPHLGGRLGRALAAHRLDVPPSQRHRHRRPVPSPHGERRDVGFALAHLHPIQVHDVVGPPRDRPLQRRVLRAARCGCAGRPAPRRPWPRRSRSAVPAARSRAAPSRPSSSPAA